MRLLNLSLSFIVAVLFHLNDASAQAPIASIGKGPMPVGAYYYPEHWQRDQWDRDIKRIADLGFSFTHYAEFAWANLEPEEGKFNFGWLDTCVNLAAKYGLKIVMCTPSATPPAWLTTKHPEILIVGEDGRQIKHGMRLNANESNPIYQQYIRRIVTKMAERYGKNPAIWGWQIDNEPHFEGLYDYSVFAQAGFKKWLKQKYGNIDRLNSAWGAAFWSFTFNNFNQIRIPNAKETHTVNPHALLDFQRYNSTALAEGLRFQSKILKANISTTQWVTTNFAYYKFLPSVDLFKSKDDLDFASHTMYLLSTFLNYPTGNLAHRLGSGMELSFSNEMSRSITGHTGVMELQPGQINWGAWNAQPLPGAVRMWIWHSFGLGDEFVCTYRFRQALFGSEQFHKAIMEPDGITVSPGGKEYETAIKEINALPITTKADGIIPASVASRSTAFLWKQDNLLGMEASKHNAAWDSWKHYYTYYENLKTMGAPVTFLQEIDSFDVKQYPLMVAPAFEMTDERLIQKWKRYVAAGGHLVLTSRTGMKDNNGHLWQSLLQQPVWDLIGAKVDGYDHLPPQTTGTIKMGDSSYAWNVWGDQLTPEKGTDVWATFNDQFYAGKATVVKNQIGKGAVYYVGTQSVKGEMEKQVLRKVYGEAGATILNLPNYVFVNWRNGFWVGVNYTSEAVELPIPAEATIVLGNKKLLPGGVTVWKQTNN